jgi:hypothetical protein
MSTTPQNGNGAQGAVTTTKKKDEVFFNPFAKTTTPGLNQGTVEIEKSRAVTEAMGKLYLAKQFPRDEANAFVKLMQSCSRKSMADEAEYAYPRGKETVTGPSIRLAEEMARVWGNIEYGIRELSDDEESTEMEAYAWDLETNLVTTQKFKVKKERSTKSGTYKLTDQRDVYEQNANLGSRRLRARILAILPPDLKDAALNQCKQTLKPSKDALPTRVKEMVAAFAKLKVTDVMIEQKQGKKIAEFTPEDIAAIIPIFNSIKDGFSKPGDWFEGVDPVTPPATEGAAGDLNNAILKSEKE